METEKFLKNERQLTDDSLVAERENANKSITQSRTHTEEQIDKDVTSDRLAADQAREVARASADRNGEDSITVERKHSDNAVELERSQADATLEKERGIKSDLVDQVFDQERKQTDKNLSSERVKADLEVSRTKISLTTRDEFLAIVSHDLRNPIGAAATCAEMLLQDSTFSNIDPEVKYWIEFIKRNVDVSLRMITDLLDVERMAVGKLEIKLEKHSIGKIIRQSVESFAHTASAKNILLRAVPIDGSDEVVCDYDRILQVFSNLIGNALKFTPDGGSINIITSVSKTEMQVSIKDTGPGIPEDKLVNIFERFAQVGSNDRRGLGLGLYISKMLVDAHGGRIWGESKINEGSTLSFTIPRVWQ